MLHTSSIAIFYFYPIRLFYIRRPRLRATAIYRLCAPSLFCGAIRPTLILNTTLSPWLYYPS